MSLGFGPVVSRGSFESSVLGFEERGTGTAVSFQIGTKWELERNVSLGLVYRAPTKIPLKGTGTLVGVGAGSFTAKQHYPAVVNVGVAWQPNGPALRFALDVEHQYWSQVKSFDRNYTNPVLDSIAKTQLDSKNSLVFRGGAVWNFASSVELRAGCSYSEAALGAGQIIPAQPDFDISSCSLGYGHKAGSIELNAGIERQWMRTRTKSNLPFPGTYRMHVNSLLLGAAYSF